MTDINEEKMSNENLKEILIRKLGIYELRAVARELGIPSPTTKRRNELVDLIVDSKNKLNSGLIANLSMTRKGRPYKKISTIDNIINAVAFDEQKLPNQIQKPAPSYDDVIFFAQEVPTFDFNSKESKILSGVVRNVNASSYFVDILDGTKVFISDENVERLNLCNGDFIKAKCGKINNGGQYLVKEVEEINLKPLNEYRIKKYDLGKSIISREKIQYGFGKISCGRRNAVCYTSDIFEDERFEELSKYCKERKIRLVVLGLNISFENDILYRSLENVIPLTTTYGSHCALGLDRVVDTISLCQNLIERGNKVLLFINDIVEILRTLDKYYGSGEQMDGHAIESVVVAQKLLSLGRAYDSSLWTTLLVAYRDSDLYETFLNNELFKVSAKVE